MSDDTMREQTITLEASAWRNTNGPVCHSSFRGGFEAGERYQAAQRQGGDELQNAEREASELAWSLWRRRCREASPDFELCDSVAGVITQINNMAAGLLEDLESAEAQLKRQGGEAVAYQVLDSDGDVHDMFDSLREAEQEACERGDTIRPLYTAPQPAVPEGFDREMIAEMLNDYANALHQGELDGAGHYTPSAIYEQADEILAQPQPDWTPCSERFATIGDAGDVELVWIANPDRRVWAGSPGDLRVEAAKAPHKYHWSPIITNERPEPPEDAGND